MAWVKWGDYARLDGNYSISKALSVSGWAYTLWEVEIKGTAVTKQVWLGCFKSFEDAKNEKEKICKSNTNASV